VGERRVLLAFRLNKSIYTYASKQVDKIHTPDSLYDKATDISIGKSIGEPKDTKRIRI